jgi:hypothetical protein
MRRTDLKTGTWQEPQAGDRTINSTFCGRCCSQMKAGEGVYTADGGRLGAGECPSPLTVREIAGARPRSGRRARRSAWTT